MRDLVSLPFVFLKQRLYIVFAVRPFGVTGDLTFPPRRQCAVEILQQGCRFGVQCGGFVANVHVTVRPGQRAQLFGFAFNFGEWFFEIQILRHAVRALVSFGIYMARLGGHCNVAQVREGQPRPNSG